MFWYTQERNYDSSSLFKASESRLKTSLNQLSEFDFSLLLYTLGQASTGSVDFWYSAEREALTRLAEGTLRRGNLGRLVIGLAESNLASDTFWERLQLSLLNSIEDLNAEGLAFIIRGLAIAKDAGEKIDDGLVGKLREQFLKNFADMDTTEQLSSVIGWASLDGENDKLWLVLSAKLVDNAQRSQPGDIIASIEALARVDRGSVKQWKYLENVILSILEDLTPDQFATAVWSFAKVDHENPRFWENISSHFNKLEGHGCATAKVLNALAGTKIVNSSVLKDLNGKVNIKGIKAAGLADWLLAVEKSDVLPRDFQKINKLVLEGIKGWTVKDKKTFISATKESKNVSGDVIKALNEI